MRSLDFPVSTEKGDGEQKRASDISHSLWKLPWCPSLSLGRENSAEETEPAFELFVCRPSRKLDVRSPLERSWGKSAQVSDQWTVFTVNIQGAWGGLDHIVRSLSRLSRKSRFCLFLPNYFKLHIYLCVCPSGRHICGPHISIGGSKGVSSLLLPCRFQGLNLDHQAWWQEPSTCWTTRDLFPAFEIFQSLWQALQTIPFSQTSETKSESANIVPWQ